MAWRGVSPDGTHPELIRRVAALLEGPEIGGRLYVRSATRTYEEQAALYRKYLAGGPLAARPGTSNHEKRRDGYGHAVDLDWYGDRDEDWITLERVAKDYGLRRTVFGGVDRMPGPGTGEPWHYELDLSFNPPTLPDAGLSHWADMFVPVLIS